MRENVVPEIFTVNTPPSPQLGFSKGYVISNAAQNRLFTLLTFIIRENAAASQLCEEKEGPAGRSTAEVLKCMPD